MSGPKIEWTINSALDKNAQRYYQMKIDNKIKKEHYGKWILIDTNKTSVFLYPTQHMALEKREDNSSYITNVGYEEIIHDPNKINVMMMYQNMPEQYTLGWDLRPDLNNDQRPTFSYESSLFRWAHIAILGKDGVYRREYFLMDTGSGSSYLKSPELYRNVEEIKGTNTNSKYRTKILGIEIDFEKSETAPNLSAHNINILGAEFLNQFCIIDDFLTSKIMLLNRYEPISAIEIAL